jgi:hypothetical protein
VWPVIDRAKHVYARHVPGVDQQNHAPCELVFALPEIAARVRQSDDRCNAGDASPRDQCLQSGGELLEYHLGVLHRRCAALRLAQLALRNALVAEREADEYVIGINGRQIFDIRLW